MIIFILIGTLICFLIVIFLLDRAPEYEQTEEGVYEKVIARNEEENIVKKSKNSHYNLKKDYSLPFKMLLSFTYFLRRIFY